MARPKTITDNSLAKISKWNWNGSFFGACATNSIAIKIFVNASLVALKKHDLRRSTKQNLNLINAICYGKYHDKWNFVEALQSKWIRAHTNSSIFAIKWQHPTQKNHTHTMSFRCLANIARRKRKKEMK